MSVIETSIQEIRLAQRKRREAGVPRAIREFLRDLQRTMFETYRPEAHYMRGPGPACAAKRAAKQQSVF